MKNGSLVRWYEMYADGIVKDGGIGIILKSVKWANYPFYEVFRCEPHLDIQMFEETNLEPFYGDNNENR